MTVAAFLTELNSRNIQLRLEGDKLKCSAPQGALTPELRSAIQSRKQEIHDFLCLVDTVSTQPRSIVPMHGHNGNRVPIFAAGGHNADIFAFKDFVRHLDANQPFYGLHPPGLNDDRTPLTRIEDLADYYADEIKSFHPEGPCIIAGYCMGGAIALELARRLQEREVEIAFLALLGCTYPTRYRSNVLYWAQRVLIQCWNAVRTGSIKKGFLYLRESIRKRAEHVRLNKTPPAQDLVTVRKFNFENVFLRAVCRYKPRKFAGRISLINPNQASLRIFEPKQWRSMADQLDLYVGPDECDVDRMLLDPDASAMASLFGQAYERAMQSRSRETSD